MLALHQDHGQSKLTPPKPLHNKQFFHPYNLHPPICIQNTHLYVQKFNDNFCTSLIRIRFSHHGRS